MEAHKWANLAADQGHATAQATLALMYHGGKSVAQDNVEAVRWYRLSAEQGYQDAQFSLGTMYENGQGVARDAVEAHKWLNLAASRKTPEYQEMYSRSRDEVAKPMTAAQVAEAQRRASEWQAAFDARQE